MIKIRNCCVGCVSASLNVNQMITACQRQISFTFPPSFSSFLLSLSLVLLQAHEAVIRGHYPAPEETLQFLAALRLQYLLGDYNPQATVPEMSQVFPMTRLRARIQNSAKTFSPATGLGMGSVVDRSDGTSEKKRSSFLEGTLRRSFRSGSMSRQKLEEENTLEAWMREEIAAARASLVDKWKKLQGMNQELAMVKYMALVKEWPGYGSTLFEVEVSGPYQIVVYISILDI